MDIDPFKNFTPKANAINQQETAKSPFPPDLSGIDSMDAEGLRKLIRTTAGAAKWIKLALLTKEEIAASMKLRLANIALDENSEVKDILVAIDKWLDRIEGKSTERVETTIKATIQSGIIYGLTLDDQIDMLETKLKRLKAQKQAQIGVVIENQ